jgi:periplasmic copper chaperone A
MKMRILLPALLAVALTTAALISFAWNADGATAGIVVIKAWARATPPGATTGAAYITLQNPGSTPDRLVNVTSAAAGSAMLHKTVEDGGVSKMEAMSGDIPAGSTLEMRPGGTHIMLMGLTGPLKQGETLSVTLDFETAEDVTVEAKIAPIGADGPVE